MTSASQTRCALNLGAPSGKRPRILFIVHRIPYPPNKGEKLRSFWELKELAKRSDVDLFAFYDDPEDARYANELRRYCQRVYLEKLLYLSSRWNAVKALASGKPLSVGFFCSQKMAQRISQALRSNRYDRILVVSSSMAQYVEEAEPVKILDLVDVDSDKWSQYAERQPWPGRWLWREEARRLSAYESKLVRDFAATLVCTDAEAALLRSKAGQGNIQVLQNFLDITKYDPRRVSLCEKVRHWQPYIVFSGSMDYFPNIDAARYFAHDVLPLVRREIPEAHFVIAGRNPHPSILKLSSRPEVQLTGSVADIKPYICGAAVAVAPMRIARGVQNKVLEALAAGVPVVTTSIAAKALPDSLQSLLSVADEPHEFAAAVTRVVQHGGPVSSSSMRAALRDHMETQDLPRHLERLLLAQDSRSPRDEGLTER